jgi:hypothetical protein
LQEEVAELLTNYRMMTQSAGKMSNAAKRMDPRNMQGAMAQMQQVLPPQLLQQMASGGGMQEMLKSMQGMRGMKGMPKGLPGMPF